MIYILLKKWWTDYRYDYLYLIFSFLFKSLSKYSCSDSLDGKNEVTPWNATIWYTLWQHLILVSFEEWTAFWSTYIGRRMSKERNKIASSVTNKYQSMLRHFIYGQTFLLFYDNYSIQIWAVIYNGVRNLACLNFPTHNN